MDMLRGKQIAEANLGDWRKLARLARCGDVAADCGFAVDMLAARGQWLEGRLKKGVSK